MNALTLLLSYAVDTLHSLRSRWSCWRDGHRMLAMADGPICLRCGTTWVWSD